MFIHTNDVKEKYSNIWMFPMEITNIVSYLKKKQRNEIYSNEQTEHMYSERDQYIII
jgi:hypothetical protein